jgi:hypothetical protein
VLHLLTADGRERRARTEQREHKVVFDPATCHRHERPCAMRRRLDPANA